MSRTKSRPVALSTADREWLVTRGPVPTQEDVYAERGGDVEDTITRTKRLTHPLVPPIVTG